MDAVTDAAKLYAESLDALREQRAQIEEDLAFSDPSNPQQWDDQERAERERDPGGARPCLVMDQIGQYVSNVAGQIEQRPPAVHAIPVGAGADIRVAEKLDGVFRQIEYASRAQQHYARALTSAARAGVGYLVLRPEVIDRALNYSQPRISSEGDPLRVVFDPWSVELDGSDANFGFLLSPLSHSEFERQFPGKEKVSFDGKEARTVTDTRESIVIAEQWYCEETTVDMVIYGRPETQMRESLTKTDFVASLEAGEQLQFLGEYRDKKRCVWWRKLSGADILQQSQTPDGKKAPYPADGIGIVPVYGYVGWSDGRMKYCGIPRRAREPQRAYNYHQSEIRAYMSQAPKAPWLASVRAVKGFEKLWDKASVESRAFLPYNDLDEEGPISPPQRAQVTVSLQNHIANAQQALQDIQAAIGMYQANLGAPSNESSGVAIDARKSQGESSTAHFQSHLAAGMAQVGRLTMQMCARLLDTPRQQRMLGIDNTPSMVQINPKQPEAVQETENGLSINPSRGTYDVRVVVGASFTTQRQQAQAAFAEMIRANPQMAPALAPLWAQSLDVPHADKLAQVLTAVAPPEVRAILQPDEKETTGALKAQMEEMKAALKEAIQHAEDAQRECDEKDAQLQQKEVESDAQKRELDIKAYSAETDRLKVTGANEEQLRVIVGDLINSMLTQPEPLPAEMPEAYEPPEMEEGMEQPEMSEMPETMLEQGEVMQ